MYFQMLDPGSSPATSENGEEKRHTKHAPDLLEGPDIDEEGILSCQEFVELNHPGRAVI